MNLHNCSWRLIGVLAATLLMGGIGIAPALGGNVSASDAHTSISVADQSSSAGSTLSRSQQDSIERVISEEMKQRGLCGLSVALAKDDSIVYHRGFGLADLETSTAVTDATRFRIGSVSKCLTAVGALQLSERKKLDLDAPVQKYVPEFPEKGHPITCRELLAHTSGIRHYHGNESNELKHYGDLVSALEIFKDDPLVNEPGTKFAYSSFGYTLLGAAMAKATGKSYADYMRENVLVAAKMDGSLIDDSLTSVPGLASGYVRTPQMRLVKPEPYDLSAVAPAAAFCCTAEDLGRFALALFADKLLSGSSRKLMWTPQTTTAGEMTRYGLGWQFANRGDMWAIYHGGTDPGYESILYLLADKRICVVLLTNVSNARLYNFADRLARLLE